MNELLFAELWSKDTISYHRYRCMNKYYQGIIFRKFVDVGSQYSLTVWCNSLRCNKRLFAAYIAFLLTPRLLMAIGMIPLYHTDKIKQPSSTQFLLCRARGSDLVTCTVQPALITTRCKGHTCVGVGSKKLHSHNSH